MADDAHVVAPILANCGHPLDEYVVASKYRVDRLGREVDGCSKPRQQLVRRREHNPLRRVRPCAGQADHNIVGEQTTQHLKVSRILSGTRPLCGRDEGRHHVKRVAERHDADSTHDGDEQSVGPIIPMVRLAPHRAELRTLPHRISYPSHLLLRSALS